MDEHNTQRGRNKSNYKPKYAKNNRGRGYENPRVQNFEFLPRFATSSAVGSNEDFRASSNMSEASSSGRYASRNDRYNTRPDRYSQNINNQQDENPHEGHHGMRNRHVDQVDSGTSKAAVVSSGRGKIISGRYIRRNPFTSMKYSNSHGVEYIAIEQNSNASDYLNPFSKTNPYQTRDSIDTAESNYQNEFRVPKNINGASARTTNFDQKKNFSCNSEHSVTNPDRSQNADCAASAEPNSKVQNEGRGQKDSNGASFRNITANFDQRKNYSRKNESFGKPQNKARGYEQASSSDVYRYSFQEANSQSKYRTSNVFTDSSSKSFKFKDNATQRELLIQHLKQGDCECLVCHEQIRVKDQTWHCLSCFHVFHLRCIRKWARSPTAVVEGSGWRCPVCQALTAKVPYDYFCFCARQKNPDVNYHLTPHSCGEICGRSRPDCQHPCKELCHPGPCPPCSVVVRISCPCGKVVKSVPCKQTTEVTCNSTCDKILDCAVHQCRSKCHQGNCPPCEEEVYQTCFCKKSNRSVTCTAETATVSEFSCAVECGKALKCGNHFCESLCHPDNCSPCAFSVECVETCSCGKSTISELISEGLAAARTSCKDPLPVCNNKCQKVQICGPKDNQHKCESLCHSGDCPQCPLSTQLKCRCGAFTKEFQCGDLTPAFTYLCEKRCNKRKDCGRHKCLSNCCINVEHRCELVCNRKLTCGSHQCVETCHGGNCPTCYNVSFDELRCHCGESVLYPPIHCGTKPPECPKPCIRSHSCNHDVKHSCHSDETCPPCTSLTVKWCYGKHKQCNSVMCFLDGVSCGSLCAKDLPCGRHKCKLTCHAGPCLKNNSKCNQACTVSRPSCGHPCGIVCHDEECPDTPCKTEVTLACPCGHRSETTSCYDSTKSFRLMSVSVLASKMQEIKEGQSVNLNEVLGKKSKCPKLQCNEECAVLERNKRLAVALQIQNPDISCSPSTTNYTEFLKTEARKSPAFVNDIYNKISDLVQLAKESKQKCRSYSFPAMNRDQRRVVHELAEFFGCETHSYDEEPKKNVVVTAYKAKCWLPFVSLMTVVQRDMGFRKGPVPVLAQRDAKANPPTVVSQKKKIDYFDYNE